MDYTRLGKRIKEERLRLNLTQEKLSEKVGISTAYLGQIERGERCITLDKLIPLANYLGVTVDFLLTDYIVTDEDNSLNILTQLFRGKTVEEILAKKKADYALYTKGNTHGGVHENIYTIPIYGISKFRFG